MVENNLIVLANLSDLVKMAIVSEILRTFMNSIIEQSWRPNFYRKLLIFMIISHTIILLIRILVRSF